MPRVRPPRVPALRISAARRRPLAARVGAWLAAAACLVAIRLAFPPLAAVGAEPDATATSPARVDPFVEHVFPPAVPRGGTSRITVAGSQLERAVGLWTSLPAGKLHVVRVISSASDSAVLEVAAAADAPLGLYALRLATEDGLSNPYPFVVDDLVPRTSLDDPQTELPVAVAGRLVVGRHERHRISVPAGRRLTFDVVASRLGNDSDPLVTIYDERGKRIAQSDNTPGLFFDTSFTHAFAAAGTYAVEVRDARYQGSAHWPYLLRIGEFPAARVTLPSVVAPGARVALRLPEAPERDVEWTAPTTLGEYYAPLRPAGAGPAAWAPVRTSPLASLVEVEPNDSPNEATPAPAAPCYLQGCLASPADRDHFALDLKKGDRLSIRAETKAIQSAADVELLLLDPSGREIQRADDVNLPGGALDEAALQFTAGQDGVYRLAVRELTRAGGPEFTYRLEVRRTAPALQVFAEVAGFAIPRGSFQVLPLTVVRQEYDGPIRLRLADAPPGVSLVPDLIPAGQNACVAALHAGAATPEGTSSFHLYAAPETGDSPAETQVVARPLLDRQAINVDLIRSGLRDNQRFLPPSLRTELALFVQPPAPFRLDAPDSNVVLPRYQRAELPLAIVRDLGFGGPIGFSATSAAQLGEETQGRKQVFYRASPLGADASTAVVSFHSRSQANEGAERVDLYATAQVGARRVTLHRSVQLAVKPAFELTLDPPRAAVPPGGRVTVRIVAKRLPSFEGPIQVALSPPPGVTAPAALEIPADRPHVDVELRTAADGKPRRDRLRFTAVAQVGGFQEEPRPVEFELEIQPAAPAASR